MLRWREDKVRRAFDTFGREEYELEEKLPKRISHNEKCDVGFVCAG